MANIHTKSKVITDTLYEFHANKCSDIMQQYAHDIKNAQNEFSRNGSKTDKTETYPYTGVTISTQPQAVSLSTLNVFIVKFW